MHQWTALLITLAWVLFEHALGQESFHYNSFVGPVSGDVEEISVPRSVFPSQYKGSYDRANDDLTFDYVAKPDYKFVYGVEDPPTGNSHKHEEERNGDVVRGEYSVLEPDGAIRRVVYTADSRNGFRATVHRTPPPSSARASHPPPANRKELSTSAESTSSTPLVNDVNPTVATQSSLKPPDFVSSSNSQERGISGENKFYDSKNEQEPVTSLPLQSYPDSTTQSVLDHSPHLSDPVPENIPRNPPTENLEHQQPYSEPLPVNSPQHTPSPYVSDYNNPNDLPQYHGPNHIHTEPPSPYSDPYFQQGPQPVHHNTLPQYAPVHNDYYNPNPPPPPHYHQPTYSDPSQYHPPLNIPHPQLPPPPPQQYEHFSDRQDPIYGSPIYPSHSPIPHSSPHPHYYGDYAY